MKTQGKLQKMNRLSVVKRFLLWLPMWLTMLTAGRTALGNYRHCATQAIGVVTVTTPWKLDPLGIANASLLSQVHILTSLGIPHSNILRVVPPTHDHLILTYSIPPVLSNFFSCLLPKPVFFLPTKSMSSLFISA